MAKLKISSTAFPDGGKIPARYTCDDLDINPPLGFEDIPPEAKSLVLVVDDPDAPGGTWVHWLVWNIAPSVSSIDEDSVPTGAIQGMNDFKKHSYGGPCPPSGVHRYFFKLYALDAMLQIGAHSIKPELEKAMKAHVLAEAHIVGLYSRK